MPKTSNIVLQFCSFESLLAPAYCLPLDSRLRGNDGLALEKARFAPADGTPAQIPKA
jgi:hypothetical protein